MSKKTSVTMPNHYGLPLCRYYGAEIKFRYLINGIWHEFTLDDIENNRASTEILTRDYERRDIIITPNPGEIGGEGEG